VTTLPGGFARALTKEIVVPKQKDLKRVVRARMRKTGESYTAARHQLLDKSRPIPAPDYARLAGMSDDAVSEKTGRTWTDWVLLLDAAQAAEKSHREIATYVSSLGTPSWWTQMVTVGYERIRGLREKGQRRGGGYEASKSRTFAAPVEQLFEAFASARRRRRWLPAGVALRSATPHKRLRLKWADDTPVQVAFVPKGRAKTMVAIQHGRLPNRPALDAVKRMWGERFAALARSLKLEA
jgi:hypothetical protein